MGINQATANQGRLENVSSWFRARRCSSSRDHSLDPNPNEVATMIESTVTIATAITLRQPEDNSPQMFRVVGVSRNVRLKPGDGGEGSFGIVGRSSRLWRISFSNSNSLARVAMAPRRSADTPTCHRIRAMQNVPIPIRTSERIN